MGLPARSVSPVLKEEVWRETGVEGRWGLGGVNVCPSSDSRADAAGRSATVNFEASTLEASRGSLKVSVTAGLGSAMTGSAFGLKPDILGAVRSTTTNWG